MGKKTKTLVVGIGLIQAMYTGGVLLVFYPTYHFFWLATLWQVCSPICVSVFGRSYADSHDQ